MIQDVPVWLVVVIASLSVVGAVAVAVLTLRKLRQHDELRKKGRTNHIEPGRPWSRR